MLKRLLRAIRRLPLPEMAESRSRSNSSFPLWRRPTRPSQPVAGADVPVTPPEIPSPVPPPSVESLIEALSPPSIPDIAIARSLIHLLTDSPPSIQPESLIRMLRTLCSPDSAVPLRCAGYEIITAYFSCPRQLSAFDRRAFMSIIWLCDTSWASDNWKQRFDAIDAITAHGRDITALDHFLNPLCDWAESAFLSHITSNSDGSDTSLEVIARFIAHVAKENAAFFTDADVSYLLGVYRSWLDRSIAAEVARTPSTNRGPSSRPALLAHHRHNSSLSDTSPTPRPYQPVYTRPAQLYLIFIANYIPPSPSFLPLRLLPDVITGLCILLSHVITPMPRLTAASITASSAISPLERTTQNHLYGLLTAPGYATSATRIVKQTLSTSKFNPGAAHGAMRAIRFALRKAGEARLARALMSREISNSMSPTGAPALTGGLTEEELLSVAWGVRDGPFELMRIGGVLKDFARDWLTREGREGVLEEIMGVVRDLLDEAEESPDEVAGHREEEMRIIGEIINTLAEIVRQVKQTAPGPYILKLHRPQGLPYPLLTDITALLALPLSTPMIPSIPETLISLAPHIADGDSARVVSFYSRGGQLFPTSPDWLPKFTILFDKFYTMERSRTRRELSVTIGDIYTSLRELPSQRKALIDLVLPYWKKTILRESTWETVQVAWDILSEEFIASTFEDDCIERGICEQIREFWAHIAKESLPWNDPLESPPISPPPIPLSPTAPIPPRSVTEPLPREREGGLINALLTQQNDHAAPLRMQERGNHRSRPSLASPPSWQSPGQPRALSATLALINAFNTLAFSSRHAFYVQVADSSDHVVPVARTIVSLFHTLLGILSPVSGARCPKARLAVLQWVVRLRADRDHRLYAVDTFGKEVEGMAALVWRGPAPASEESLNDDPGRRSLPESSAIRETGRNFGRGPNHIPRARSQSRPPFLASASIPPPPSTPEPLWNVPEMLPFSIPGGASTPTEGMATYNAGAASLPDDAKSKLWLPVSLWVLTMVEIIENEKDWELLSYTLCHIPVQLANKHFFCGPKARIATVKLVASLCRAIHSNGLAAKMDLTPSGLKITDVQGLAYHTLSILISYHQLFDRIQKDFLVEVFVRGLNRPSTASKPCLQALSIAAFELPQSMTKYLSHILEKLSRIMTNPAMAVHILELLCVVGSLPPLYANSFREGDYKLVFALALQYIHHHNQPGSETLRTSNERDSYALAQHVLGVAFYIIYVWFLGIKLSDRPKYIPFIARYLLLANESKGVVDEPSEVCFDWLARYAYGSADPRPARSFLHDMLTPGDFVSEKTWLLGNSLFTSRILPKAGWMELISRRPSGTTSALCRIENVALIGLGDIGPDMTSLPAMLLASRDPQQMASPVFLSPPVPGEPIAPATSQGASVEEALSIFTLGADVAEQAEPRPDPLTGFVWSGPAPSQRRKDVAIDPAYIPLLLSPYPNLRRSSQPRLIRDAKVLASALNIIDRIPVIDMHAIGIMYVAPGQTDEKEILGNRHGSPAYTRFLAGLGRLINLRGNLEVYTAQLDPDVDGEYAYAWWDDIGQILYHTATLMPNQPGDAHFTFKKRHIGNDRVRVIWNDGGTPYRFDTLKTAFQFVNIVIEPHSLGTIAAFSNNLHENEFFRVSVQLAENMPEITPLGDCKLISAENLPHVVRQFSLLADFFTGVWVHTAEDTQRHEFISSWRYRLQEIKRFRDRLPALVPEEDDGSALDQEFLRDFTKSY